MQGLSFNTHKYAPELNKVYVRGVELPPSALKGVDLFALNHKCHSYAQKVNEIRRGLKQAVFSRTVLITVTYSNPDHKSLNKEYRFGIQQTQDIIWFKKMLKGWHTLPDASFKVSFPKRGK